MPARCWKRAERDGNSAPDACDRGEVWENQQLAQEAEAEGASISEKNRAGPGTDLTEMDGFTLTRKIKTYLTAEKIPVVISLFPFSGSAANEERLYV